MAAMKYDNKREDKSLWNPWDFERDIHHMFDRLLEIPKDWEFPLRGGGIFPSVDISETPAEYVLRAEIPGMKKEDTKLSIHRNVLTISGEKKSETRHEDKKYHRVESYYGSFQRGFVLPDPIKADKVSASFKDGVLVVTVPKAGEAREKAVEIKVE